MPAENVDLYVEQGATFTMGFVWAEEGPLDGDGNPTQGDPHDLTGWSARLQIRRSPTSPLLAEASTTNGRIVIDPLAGRVDIKLEPAATQAITAKSAKYDLELESPEGDVYRLLQGNVTIDDNITHEG
jgi:hypothetical protein